MAFGRRFVTGPAEALERLKRAAEQRSISSSQWRATASSVHSGT